MKKIYLIPAVISLTLSSCSQFKGPAPASVQGNRSIVCNLSELSELSVPQPKVWGKEGRTGRSSASDLVYKLVAPLSCEVLKSTIRNHLSASVAASWDDFVYLTIVKNHFAKFMQSRTSVMALGLAADMTSGFRPGDHDRFNSSKYSKLPGGTEMNVEALAIDFRNVVMQLSLEEFRGRNLRGGYEGVPNLTNSEREEIAQSVAQKLSGLRYDEAFAMRNSELSEKAHEFALHCEKKLTSIFGNPGYSAAVATGWDRNGDPKTKTLLPYVNDRYSTVRRFHTISNMHVYRNLKSSESKELMYLPPTCGTGGSGTGMGCRTYADGKCDEYKESFPSYCAELGRFKGVNIMVAHISIQGQKVPKIKNSAGSTSIGFLAGPGGSGGLAPGEPNNGYAHSHIQLTGGGFRLSFSDALCRTE